MMKNILNWFKGRFGVSSDPGMKDMLLNFD